MVQIRVNLDEVPDGFFLAPEDSYHLQVQEGTKLGKSKAGNAKIGWICQIMDGEYEDQKIYFETSLVEEALWNLKGLVKALKIEWDEEGFDLEDCIHREFVAKLSVEPYEGRDFQQAGDYTPVGGWPEETKD